MVTTDKVYRDPRGQAFTEEAPLGGTDPYSASKAAAELAVAASQGCAAERGLGLATARAGNTVGGGDWAADRLVPDCARATLRGEPVVLRQPGSVRPWTHVLDVLDGYLRLASALWEDPAGTSGAWNFAASAGDEPTVQESVEIVLAAMGSASDIRQAAMSAGPREVGELRLDASKARTRLGWQPRYTAREALAEAGAWAARVRGGSAPAAAMEQSITTWEGRG
jgi:CDP-glucose 4,6-dehydratase